MKTHIKYLTLFIAIVIFSSSCGNNIESSIIPTENSASSSSNPDTSYFSPSDQSFGSGRTFGIEIADIDLDNDLDIFVTNYIGPDKLWINDGSGGFTESGQSFGKYNGQAHDVGIADLNGDSYPDIFLIFHGDASRIFFNDGEGNFSDSGQEIGSQGENPQTIVLGDIDGDKDVDAFLNYSRKPNRLWVNNGQGVFERSDFEYGGNSAPSMVLFDLNGDNTIDVIYCYLDSPPEVMINDGMGNFPETGYPIGAQNGCDGIDVGDIDRDGDSDIVITTIAKGIKAWLNSDNTGEFIEAGSYFYPGTIKVKLVDIDLDGDLDLVAGNTIKDETRVWLNTGSGSFTSSEILIGTTWAFRIEAGKLDADDDYDLIVGNENDSIGWEIFFSTIVE